MDAYTEHETPVDILEIAEPLVSVGEWCDFHKRLDRRLNRPELTFQLCLDYALGCVDARTSLKRLQDNGLLQTPDQLMTVICAGVGALAPELPYPEPGAGAMPNQELVRVLADARRQREKVA